MNSLRGILTRWLLCAILLLSLAAGAALYFSMRQALLEQFDAGLVTQTHAIGSTLRIEHDGHYEMDFADESMMEYLPGKHAEYFEVIRPDGSILELSKSLAEKPLIDPAIVPRRQTAWNLALPNGRTGRAMSYSTVPTSDDEDRDSHATTHITHPKAEALLVIVARSRHEIDEVLGRLLTAMIVTAAILTIAAIIAVRFSITRGLRPVNAFSEQAAAIGPETLDYRFNVAALPLELRSICIRLNDLLERLDCAFQRERRINADIAHELRTPIAELRSLAEVAQRWPCDADQSAAYFRDAHEISLRMESMVETLLALARSQSRKTHLRLERIELSPLIRQIDDALHDRIELRGLSIAFDIPANFSVTTDRVMFRRILENLLANAVQYTPTGGKIECSAALQGPSRGLIIIANTNDSLTSVDLPRMFEPFWRKDAARSGDSHAGLGLALVAEYAAQLGVTITPTLPAPDWFAITLAVEYAPSQAVCDPAEQAIP